MKILRTDEPIALAVVAVIHSGDIDTLRRLLDENPGLAAGTPMADARAFKQWKAAHRLVERGARMTLFDAAALGLMSRISPYFAGDAPPTNDEINGAFWLPAMVVGVRLPRTCSIAAPS